MDVNDKVSMEYEARVMLSEEQYLRFVEDKMQEGRPYKDFSNENTYYETDELDLIKAHAVLRIRSINKVNNELTLKVQGELGDKEITSPLTDEEANRLLEGKPLEDKDVLEALKDLNVPLEKLHVYTSLVTERIEIPYDEYLLVIDKNIFHDKIDYNLEVESSSRKLALKYLKKEIKPYKIKYKKDYISKSRRAILNK